MRAPGFALARSDLRALYDNRLGQVHKEVLPRFHRVGFEKLAVRADANGLFGVQKDVGDFVPLYKVRHRVCDRLIRPANGSVPDADRLIILDRNHAAERADETPAGTAIVLRAFLVDGVRALGKGTE